MVTSKQVAAIKYKSGQYKHSRYFRKKDVRFVDKYTRNLTTPKGRIVGRDVIVHRRTTPVRPTVEYRVGGRR